VTLSFFTEKTIKKRQLIFSTLIINKQPIFKRVPEDLHPYLLETMRDSQWKKQL